MSLKRATAGVIAALLLIYALRLVGTLQPEAFQALPMAQLAVVLHLLAAAAMLWFYAAFAWRFMSRSSAGLRSATVLAAAGAAAGLLAPLQAASRVFHVAEASTWLRSPLIEPLAPLIATVTTLLFVLVFRNESKLLRRPATAALVGYGIFAGLQLVVLALALASGRLRWLTEMSQAVVVGVLPLVTGALIAVVIFYWALYRQLPRQV